MKLASATQSEKPSFATNQYESILQDVNSEEKSVISPSENLEVTINFLKDFDKQNQLLSSKAVINDPPFLDSVEVSSE